MGVSLLQALSGKTRDAFGIVASNASGAIDVAAKTAGSAVESVAHAAGAAAKVVATNAGDISTVAASKVSEAADAIKEKSPENVVKRAKVSAFKDGVNEGAHLMANKAYAYSFALVALTVYVARCDGAIEDEEVEHLRANLKHLRANEEMSQSVRDGLVELAHDESLEFEDVAGYLDQVSLNTLENLRSELDEMIEADGRVVPEEELARRQFADYIEQRRMAEVDDEQ